MAALGEKGRREYQTLLATPDYRDIRLWDQNDPEYILTILSCIRDRERYLVIHQCHRTGVVERVNITYILL